MDIKGPNMPMTPPTAEVDGVMVLSVWARAENGQFLARILTNVTSLDEPMSRVVNDRIDLHAAIDQWLDTLDVE